MYDRRRGKPAPKKVPLAVVEKVLGLYREKYFDLNVRHFHGSEHRWFQDERWYDLLVIVDDANSEIYYAQLVEEEATVPVLAGLKEVVERKGVFCALYSDRARHFWLTAKAGEAVDHDRLTQVGRALRELGVRMIPAYSPQARGRSERSFGTSTHWRSNSIMRGLAQPGA